MLLNLTVFAEEKSVTVSSECDISDIKEPLDATPTNATIGQKFLLYRKKRLHSYPFWIGL